MLFCKSLHNHVFFFSNVFRSFRGKAIYPLRFIGNSQASKLFWGYITKIQNAFFRFGKFKQLLPVGTGNSWFSGQKYSTPH